MALTVDAIQKAGSKGRATRWLTDKSQQWGAGRLLVRVSANGNKQFYFRYSSGPGDRHYIPMLPFTREPRDGHMTLVQAREKATEYSVIYRTTKDVRGHLDRVDREKKKAEAAEVRRIEKEQAEEKAAKVYNLRALAAEYVAGMEQRGKKRSASDARNIFKNHLDQQPIADKPARDVAVEDVTALLRRLVQAGKGRTAGKMRSYLRAAYAQALGALGDANAPAAMIEYKITSNPVAATKALAEFSKARDRTLTAPELHGYWQRLEAVENVAVRGALQIALLLGGQRAAQLLRLTRADVDLPAGTLILRDSKGKRAQPRVHELPLTSKAKAILEPLVSRAASLTSDWVFTTDGKTAVYPDTLTMAVRDISSAMKKSKDSAAPFKLSDLRRTAETMMAAMGISRDVRAQIQSHGLGGVQAKHYDRHDYRMEKLDALTRWARKVTTAPKRAPVESINKPKGAKHA